jgi:hypothetical protein
VRVWKQTECPCIVTRVAGRTPPARAVGAQREAKHPPPLQAGFAKIGTGGLPDRVRVANILIPVRRTAGRPSRNDECRRLIS